MNILLLLYHRYIGVLSSLELQTFETSLNCPIIHTNIRSYYSVRSTDTTESVGNKISKESHNVANDVLELAASFTLCCFYGQSFGVIFSLFQNSKSSKYFWLWANVGVLACIAHFYQGNAAKGLNFGLYIWHCNAALSKMIKKNYIRD